MQDYLDAATLNEIVAKARADGYKIDEHDVIRSPGRFDEEHASVLYWYDAMTNGDGNLLYFEDNGSSVTAFDIDQADREPCGFPTGYDSGRPARYCLLETTAQGFVLLTYHDTETERDIVLSWSGAVADES